MLTESDLNTRIYPEVQAAIDRDDEDLLSDAIAFAISTTKKYLGRYNTDTLFAATGSDRDGTLLSIMKDLCVHEFTKLANVQMDLTLIENNYIKARDLLKDIQKSEVADYDWPLRTTPTGSDQNFHIDSVAFRETRW